MPLNISFSVNAVTYLKIIMCKKDKLMYQSDMQRLNIAQQCPCDYCREVEGLDAYRFMYGNLIQEDDFLPQLLKAERDNRPPRGYIGEPIKTCESIGLSFFLTAHQAKASFQSAKGFPNMNPSYTCVGKCRLTPADGVVDGASKKGHFNVHPYLDAPMKSTIVFDSFLTI